MMFEQQAGEGSKPFAAFSLYLSGGDERSLADVARKLSRSQTLIERWSRRWRWRERVEAYNGHLAAVEREAAAAIVRLKAAAWVKRDEELRDQEWASREEALALARQAIGRWRADPEKAGTLEGIARLLDLASTLGHRATGSPTERVAVTGDDGGPVRVEFEAALKKVYGQVIEVRSGECGVRSDDTSPLTPLPSAERGTGGQRRLTSAATGGGA